MTRFRFSFLFLLLPIWMWGQSGYQLVATYELMEPGRSWMCRNYTFIQEDVIDLKAFETRRKELLTQYKDQSILVRLVSPDEAVMVFEYDKTISGWNCTKKVVAIRIGKDLASCQRQIDEDVRTWPNDYKSPPKSIFQRGPSSATGTQVVKQNWDGVEIEYTYISKGENDRFVVIKAKNTLADKTAVIGQFLIVNSKQEVAMKPVQQLFLNPGERTVFKLDAKGDYKLGLQLVPPQKKNEPFSVIQWVKEQIRSQVTKDGYIYDTKKGKIASIGVRG